MKYIKSKWTIVSVLLLAVAALTAFKLESVKAPQYFTEQIQKGDIQNVVQATGSYHIPIWMICAMVAIAAFLFTRIDPTVKLAPAEIS